MRRHAIFVPFAAIATLTGALLAPATAARPDAVPAAAGASLLTTYRAAHHPGYDRVVFQFRGPLPARITYRFVSQLVGDGSGLPVPVAGAAKLRVEFQWAAAHSASGAAQVPARTAYALPGVNEVVKVGDFEGHLTFGIGLSKVAPVRVLRLSDPSRFVLDIGTSYRTVGGRVYFVNGPNYAIGRAPLETAVWRPVATPAVLASSLHRLFAGPTPAEKARGLRLVLSGATGYSKVTLANGVARVYLTGAVTSGGSTETIAKLIMPTLKQYPTVRWVKIYDQNGRTERPTGFTDSIPASLEP